MSKQKIKGIPWANNQSNLGKIIGCILGVIALVAIIFFAIKLFNKECEHEWGDWSVSAAATCAAEGEDKRVCAKCDVVETKKTEKISHTPADWATEKEATCTEDGILYRLCTACGEKVEFEYVPKSHTPVTDPAKSPTCLETGLTEGSHCSVCDHVIVKQDIVEKIPHILSGDICTLCGTAQMCDHNIVVDPYVAPTCQSTGLSEGKHCSVCGSIFVDQNVLDKIDHIYDTVTGKCTMCDNEQ